MRSRFVGLLLLGLTARAQSIGVELSLNDPHPWEASGTQTDPAVVADATGYLVVWADRRSGMDFDLWAMHLSPALGVVDAAATRVITLPGDQLRPSVTWDGTRYLFAWVNSSGPLTSIQAQFVSSALQPAGAVSTLSLASLGGSVRPSCAYESLSDRFAVAWGEDGAGQDVRVAIVDASLAPVAFVTPSFPGGQSRVMVSAADGDFGLAWVDTRSSPTAYFSRVTSAGAVLDGTGLPVAAGSEACLSGKDGTGWVMAWSTPGGDIAAAFISPSSAIGPTIAVAAGSQTENAPSCASDGNQALVAFQDYRSGSSSLYGYAVFPDGGLGVELPIAPGKSQPAIATTGGEFFVAGVATAPGYINASDVYGVRVSPPAVTDAPPFIVSRGGGPQLVPRAIYDGTSYLVCWRDQSEGPALNNYQAQRIAPGSGARLGPDAGLRMSFGAFSAGKPVLATSDAGFYAEWGDHGSAGQLYSSRVSPAGIALDTGGLLLSDTTNYVGPHTVEWTGSSWTSVWMSNLGMRLRRRSETAFAITPTEVQLFPLGASPGELRSAQQDDVMLLVWSQSSPADIVAARWTEDAGVLDAPFLTIAANAGTQNNPAVAGGAAPHFLVTWTERADGGADILGARLSKSGVPLDATPFVIAAGPTLQHHSTAAFVGGVYLVTWEQEQDIWAARVSVNGLVLDPAGFAVSTAPDIESNPDVTAGPAGEALIAYERFDPAAGFADFRARARLVSFMVFDGGGTLVDAGVDAGVNDAGTATDGGFASSDAGPVVLSLRLTAASAACGQPFEGRVETVPDGRWSWRIVEAPEGVTIDESGTLRWLPSNAVRGTAHITIAVSEGGQERGRETFDVEVACERQSFRTGCACSNAVDVPLLGLLLALSWLRRRTTGV